MHKLLHHKAHDGGVINRSRILELLFVADDWEDFFVCVVEGR